MHKLNLMLKNSTPELILAFIGISLFVADSNISNAPERILFFLISLGVFSFCKYLMTADVLRTEVIFSRNNRFISYGFFLIEFGVMLNLYIVGFTDRSTNILNYLFGLIKPSAIFLSIYFIFRTLGTHDIYQTRKIGIISFLVSLFIIWGFQIPETFSAEDIFKSVGIPALEALLIVLGLMVFYGLLNNSSQPAPARAVNALFQRLCRQKYAVLLIYGFHALLCVMVLVLTRTNVFGNMLTARVAAVELLKLSLLGCLAMIQCINSHNPERISDFISKYKCKSCLSWSCLCAFFFTTMLTFMLCGEMGTCLILGVLFVLISFSCLNSTFGLNAIFLFVILYLLAWKLYVMGVFDSFLTEKLNRLFNLDGFTQINDMNAVINESNAVFQLIPYNISMVGQLTTRIEDFSYLNIISVFGTLFAALFLFCLLVIPYVTAYSFSRHTRQYELHSLSGSALYDYNLFTISKWSLLLFIANSMVHVVSNLGIFIFTGVTMPLVSNGFMNTIITIFSFLPVIRCLGVNAHETEKNQN